MIVNHIQGHRNPCIVVSLNHGFQISDSLTRIIWIGRKTGFWCIIVLWIIAPVISNLAIFIIVLMSVRNRLELHDIDT